MNKLLEKFYKLELFVKKSVKKIRRHYQKQFISKNQLKSDLTFHIPKEAINYIKEHPEVVALAIATALSGSVLVNRLPDVNHKQAQQKTKSITLNDEKENKNVKVFSVENNTLSKEFQLALQKKIPVMIKIEPTGYTYADIYKTIDFVKEIVTNYQVDYPILYDIEPLMGENTLRANCLLAEEFCNKLSANGCYVGLYGSDTSMEQFAETFIEVTNSHSIDLYDKCVTYSKNVPIYQGVYHMSQKEGKEIVFQYDLATIIKENGLNNSKRFVEDQIYTVQVNETLETIAINKQMKVEDLANYNQIDNPDQIYVGQKIVIPNHYQEEKEESNHLEKENLESETRNRLVKGIDVSEHQGKIDWNEVQKEVDYAIVRLCDFYNKKEDGTCLLDEQFLNNIEACEQLNIPVGIYYYSRAMTEREAVEEAKFVSQCLKTYTLEYPVYMDIETNYQENLMDNDPNSLKKIVTAAMVELEGEGYYAGVYCNRGGDKDNNRRQFINDMSQYYSFWTTSGTTYNNVVDFSEFKTDDYNILLLPNTEIAMYQYSQCGSINGIDSQFVDLNYANQDLKRTIVENGFSKVKKYKP